MAFPDFPACDVDIGGPSDRFAWQKERQRLERHLLPFRTDPRRAAVEGGAAVGGGGDGGGGGGGGGTHLECV